MMELRRGQLFAGRYSVIEPIGGGGFGKSYLARDARDDRIVALKVLHTDAANERPQFADNFLSTMKLWMSLRHANIVELTDSGASDEGVFAVMEFLKGQTLHERLRTNGTLDWEQLKPIAAQTCDALSAVHGAGLLHGDIKPGEIFLTTSEAGELVKLLDTPLSRPVSPKAWLSERDGIVSGTEAYISPEQVRRALGEEVSYDHRIDIFALGVVMYRSLVGYAPYKGENGLEALLRRTREAPVSPRELRADIPAGAEAAVMRALSTLPSGRPQTAKELKEEILRS